MNPILPLSYYMPDAEARVWKDGTIYLYGSWDIEGNTEYCSREYYVMSSADFINWTKHEICLQNSHNEIPWGEGLLFAPDCMEKDGRYYLFFCLSDGSEGVAHSTSPVGPFENPVPVKGADKLGIDPAVFKDEDGQIYYFWGQFQLQGGKLGENMCELLPDTIVKGILTEKQHGFHEGASMRKRGKYYYLIYTDISRGRATCLSYAKSESPLGPFEKGGVILDNTGCDPVSWNNHGSIQEINGKWYLFYHRSTHNSKFSRRVCVEEITFDSEGEIKEVEMTTQGQEPPVPASRSLHTSRASRLFGTAFVDTGIGTQEEFLNGIENDSAAEFKYLSFQGETMVEAELLCRGDGGTIEVRLDAPDGELIGRIQVEKNPQWHKVTAPVKKTQGVHALYLTFRGKEGILFYIKTIRFA